jgi:hypothetical protein
MADIDWDEVEELVPIKSPGLLGLSQSRITLRSWIDHGLYCRRSKARVKLESTLRGGRRFTSRERLLAFYRKLNGIKA